MKKPKLKSFVRALLIALIVIFTLSIIALFQLQREKILSAFREQSQRQVITKI
jgi:hypothetical protein